jgi:hypothetical protein
MTKSFEKSAKYFDQDKPQNYRNFLKIMITLLLIFVYFNMYTIDTIFMIYFNQIYLFIYFNVKSLVRREELYHPNRVYSSKVIIKLISIK